MRFFMRLVLALLLITFGGAGGFLAATKYRAQFDALAGQIRVAGGASNHTDRKIIYYRNPMGGSDISPTPKKDSMGMDYLPVYAGDVSTGGMTGPDGRKIIFYRNPMGVPGCKKVEVWSNNGRRVAIMVLLWCFCKS